MCAPNVPVSVCGLLSCQPTDIYIYITKLMMTTNVGADMRSFTFILETLTYFHYIICNVYTNARAHLFVCTASAVCGWYSICCSFLSLFDFIHANHHTSIACECVASLFLFRFFFLFISFAHIKLVKIWNRSSEDVSCAIVVKIWGKKIYRVVFGLIAFLAVVL